ncbi:hypothetical protein BDR04DRAFT_1120905 [Suillus decipiens]|nr:hypothetical protein BDR04DRAFT_1120905 [Suillus decipiens]
MRFSSAIILVAAALASSISARPTDDGTMLARNAQCSTFCVALGDIAPPFFANPVWFLVLTRELLVICRIDQRVGFYTNFLPFKLSNGGLGILVLGAALALEVTSMRISESAVWGMRMLGNHVSDKNIRDSHL